jgi:hypothetical protein
LNLVSEKVIKMIIKGKTNEPFFAFKNIKCWDNTIINIFDWDRNSKIFQQPGQKVENHCSCVPQVQQQAAIFSLTD